MKRRQKLILVAEDDASIRRNLVDLLEEEGYRAVGVENGVEALRFLRGTPVLPSLILLDLMMPVMNGWQFKAQQEIDSRLRNIPVVIITADSNAQAQGSQMNVSAWIKKPIEIDTLLKAVQVYSIVQSTPDPDDSKNRDSENMSPGSGG